MTTKKILSAIFVFLAVFTFSQNESLGSMKFNVKLNPVQNYPIKQKKLQNSFDSTFYYLLDTISIPILEDFSTNKFQQYNASYNDSFVSDTIFYRILFEGAPVQENKEYSTTKTYRYVIDTTLDQKDQIDTLPLLGKYFRKNNLESYPITFNDDSLFPPYDLYDTINFNNSLDTVYRLENIIKQGKARLFFAKINEPNILWVDDFAYHNYTKAIAPFSLGIATLDGLDDKGVPYNSSQASHGIADYLTSKVIDLEVNVADSIYFSFLYQGGGYGETPEENDSLVLDFYSPDDKKWNRIWATEGKFMDTFFRVHLPIRETKYLKKGFRFRFKNYANLSGNLDNWNIDYIRLKASPGLGYKDTTLSDVAWSMPINSLLTDFTSIPWKHYQNLDDKNSIFTDSMPSIIRNSSPIEAFDQGGSIQLNEPPNTVIKVVPNDFFGDISNGLNFAPRLTVKTFHNIKESGYFFPDDPGNDTFKIFPIMSNFQTSSVQILKKNDTTRFNQIFFNYYSYDDGSAEQTYGTIGAQSMFAYKFNALQEDSLVGIAMHFVRGSNNVEDNPFLLTVWDDENGKPGNILYQDDFFNSKYPKYTQFNKGFYIYTLKNLMKLKLPKTFYIGWRQIDHERLDIGFDRNTNQSDKMFYSINGGTSWQNSQFKGSVMMRPIITSKLNYKIGIKDNIIIKNNYKLFPNPVKNRLNISGNLEKLSSIKITDLNGKLISTYLPINQLDISNLKNGFYLIQIINKTNEIIQINKIIVR